MTERVKTPFIVVLNAIIATGCLLAIYFTELGLTSGITFIFLVMKHEGEIKAQSEVGKGSTFEFAISKKQEI